MTHLELILVHLRAVQMDVAEPEGLSDRLPDLALFGPPRAEAQPWHSGHRVPALEVLVVAGGGRHGDAAAVDECLGCCLQSQKKQQHDEPVTPEAQAHLFGLLGEIEAIEEVTRALSVPGQERAACVVTSKPHEVVGVPLADTSSVSCFSLFFFQDQSTEQAQACPNQSELHAYIQRIRLAQTPCMPQPKRAPRLHTAHSTGPNPMHAPTKASSTLTYSAFD